jgi:DNA-binding response OmpR family regulator
MLLDWDMPLLNGMEVVRIVRSPGVFPRPNLPIIMLTNQGHRSAVVQALHAGVNEFLVKPTSAKALHDRLSSIVANPRPMVQLGDAYVPQLSAPLTRASCCDITVATGDLVSCLALLPRPSSIPFCSATPSALLRCARSSPTAR